MDESLHVWLNKWNKIHTVARPDERLRIWSNKSNTTHTGARTWHVSDLVIPQTLSAPVKWRVQIFPWQSVLWWDLSIAACVYVCMYVCMYTYVCMYVCACVYTTYDVNEMWVGSIQRVFMYDCMYICVYDLICMYVLIYAFMAFMYACICMYMYEDDSAAFSKQETQVWVVETWHPSVCEHSRSKR